MDDKDVNSYVDELMAKGVDGKLNGMLGDSDGDIQEEALATRDSMLSANAEQSATNNVVVVSADSNHVEQKPSIIVNNNVSYAPPHQPQSPYLTHPASHNPHLGSEPTPSITPEQRETDECLTGPQCAELHECLEQIITLAKPLNTDITKPKLWSGVSDFCDVPKNIVPPRYKSISQNNFHKAIYFFNRKKCELLAQQLEVSRAAERQMQTELRSYINALDSVELDAVNIASAELEQRDKQLNKLNIQLQQVHEQKQQLNEAKSKVEKQRDKLIAEAKQSDRAVNILIAMLGIVVLIVGLGWVGMAGFS
ncbi:hypothetical protein CXF86_19090 [Shewanella sp. GutCb]|uniref:hypothetical protein n=1 Tax=Shewanella sp. GutCb TaxID=2058315 RepID=UPI000C7C87A3|nr:hypothetical protein [Shewanella sp. GutCb]PKG73157.1 hypothetical protein CXF86_19090 [Shewanella sp. GutCb]